MNWNVRQRSWLRLAYPVGNGTDMIRRRSAAPTNDVKESAFDKFTDHIRHVFRRVIILPKFIGKPRIGMEAYKGIRHPGKGLDMGPQVLGAQSAVNPIINGLACATEFQKASGV